MTKKRIREAPGASDLPAKVSLYSDPYSRLVSDISSLLEQARRTSARTVNSILTVTYWQIGRRIIEFEQKGQARAPYGKQLLARLSRDLTKKHGRGFSRANVQQMRLFYLLWEICQTPSGKLEARAIFPTESAENRNKKCQTLSANSAESIVPVAMPIQLGLVPADVFPLSWSQYVRLMSVEKPQARAFYETEAIRGGWSVRQLDRQISTQFYERAVRSKAPSAFLASGQTAGPQDAVSVEEEVRDPYLLEFLNLKDEYSEGDLEEALVRHMEWFLLEMGTGFAFVARQKRIRIGNSWYRIDLLLYHRILRCLVVIDLKTGAFTHAPARSISISTTRRSI